MIALSGGHNLPRGDPMVWYNPHNFELCVYICAIRHCPTKSTCIVQIASMYMYVGNHGGHSKGE